MLPPRMATSKLVSSPSMQVHLDIHCKTLLRSHQHSLVVMNAQVLLVSLRVEKLIFFSEPFFSVFTN